MTTINAVTGNSINHGEFVRLQLGIPVDAGYFIVGSLYTITSVGSTVFTSIGAASNTVGITFTATGVGTGDGSASIVNSLMRAGGIQSTRTITGGGKQVDGNGDVLVFNTLISSTQQPVAGFFDNSTANRLGRIVVRDYGQNDGNFATSSTSNTTTHSSGIALSTDPPCIRTKLISHT